MDEHKDEFEQLMAQLDNGQYDGDGPADVEEVYQETSSEEEMFDGE